MPVYLRSFAAALMATFVAFAYSQAASAAPRAATPDELAALSPQAREVWFKLVEPDTRKSSKPSEIFNEAKGTSGRPRLLSEAELESIYALADKTGWAASGRQAMVESSRDVIADLVGASARSPLGTLDEDPLGSLADFVRKQYADLEPTPRSHVEAERMAKTDLEQRYPGFAQRLASESEGPMLKKELSRLTIWYELEETLKRTRVDRAAFIKKVGEQVERARARAYVGDLGVNVREEGGFWLAPKGSGYLVDTPESSRIWITDLRQLKGYRVSITGGYSGLSTQGATSVSAGGGSAIFTDARGKQFGVVVKQAPHSLMDEKAALNAGFFRGTHSMAPTSRLQEGLYQMNNRLGTLEYNKASPAQVLQAILDERAHLQNYLRFENPSGYWKDSNYAMYFEAAWSQIDPDHWQEVEDASNARRQAAITAANLQVAEEKLRVAEEKLRVAEEKMGAIKSRSSRPSTEIDSSKVSNKAKDPSDEMTLFKVRRPAESVAGDLLFFRVEAANIAHDRPRKRAKVPSISDRALRNNELEIEAVVPLEISTRSDLAVPVPDGYDVIGIRDLDSIEAVKAFQDPETGLIRIQARSAGTGTRLRVRYRLTKTPPTSLPDALAHMDRDKVVAISRELRDARLGVLADRIDSWVVDAAARGVPLDAGDLAAVFSRTALYSYNPELTRPLAEAKGRYALYSRFVDIDGKLCYQCSGANSLFEDVLRHYLGESSSIHVTTDVGFVEKGGLIRKGDAHRRVAIEWKGKRRLLSWSSPIYRGALDAVPSEHAPNYAEIAAKKGVQEATDKLVRAKAEAAAATANVEAPSEGALAEKAQKHEVNLSLLAADELDAQKTRLRESFKKIQAARQAMLAEMKARNIRNLDPSEPMARAFRDSSTYLEYMSGDLSFGDAASRMGLGPVASEADYIDAAAKHFAAENKRILGLAESRNPRLKRLSGAKFSRLGPAQALYQALGETDRVVTRDVGDAARSCIPRMLREILLR